MADLAQDLGGGVAPEVGSKDKLILVTREDLKLGQQAVQAAHALREFGEKHPEIDRLWYGKSNYLALLVAPDEEALNALVVKARRRGIRLAEFREPDLHEALTAVAMEPSVAARRLCRKLPLAFR